MRKHLMLSTAAVGLMLASGLAFAQPPGERRDEPRRVEEPARGASPQQDRGSAQDRIQEKVQGPGRDDKGGANRQATDEKNKPAAAAERNQPDAKEQAQDNREQSRAPARERNREAESSKSGREGARSSADSKTATDGKTSAETKQDKAAPSTSAAKSDKAATGPGGQRNERAGTAANQNEPNQTQPPRNAEQQPAAQQTNRPTTAADTSRTQTNTQVTQQSQVSVEKQVRLSETLRRGRLAEPERNLNISIRIGEPVPQTLHLHRLPPDIVSIEPEYRDYEYFTTDDDVVIVEPRTHRIVSQVPRDPSRARAQISSGGSSTVAAASNTGVNCRIMRRDATGNVVDAEPSTVGSSARTDSLSVTVQLPGGGSSAPIPLGASAGDIVVATQGQGDCTVTIEPQTR